MTESTLAQRMEEVIREYIRTCNTADAAGIAACFTPNATHYFPWQPSWTGATNIGENWAKAVQQRGVSWTVDQLLTDVGRNAVALEWTALTPQPGRIMRGVDWFVFDPVTVRIQEVRPYIAAPMNPEVLRQEQLDFDYAGRGYPTR
jgi:hypothetical protein